MNKKLYVGNLPYKATEDAMKAHFGQAGEVAAVQIIKDKFTGRSKGFGFVEMADEAGAQNAISMFNEKDFDGRQIFVSEARPMVPRDPAKTGQ